MMNSPQAELGQIRLLCCAHDLRGRGAEKVLTTLLERFDRRKYRLGLFVFHDVYSLHVPEDVEILPAHVPDVPRDAGMAALVMANVRKLLAFRKAVRLFRPDVALSVAGTNIALIITRYIADRSFKVIASEHSMPSSTLADVRRKTVRLLTAFLTRITYRRADLIVTPAELVKEELTKLFGVPEEKVLVIRNPVDVEEIRAASEEAVTCGLPLDDTFRIGYIGSLSQEKDVATLLRGFSLLQGRRFRAVLFLVGDGRERSALESLAGELGIRDAVHFLGFQRNPYCFLKSFDVLVLPSRYEVFPNVIIEALSLGVPVISSAWRGSDLIYTDGKNCLFFPSGDQLGLVDAMERLLTNPDLRKELSENGRELVMQCNAASIAEQYEAVITEVLWNQGTNSSGLKTRI